MRNHEHSVTSLTLLVVLAACATDPPLSHPEVQADGMPNAELALERSLGRVDRTMAELSGSPSIPPIASTPVPPAELQRPVSIAWSGPLDEGTRALANRVGYRLVVHAPQSPNPVIVSVTLSDVPILDVFREFGTQAGTHATVSVDWGHHQVEIDHHD